MTSSSSSSSLSSLSSSVAAGRPTRLPAPSTRARLRWRGRGVRPGVAGSGSGPAPGTWSGGDPLPGLEGPTLTPEDRSALVAAWGAWGEGGRQALVGCVRARRDAFDALFYARVSEHVGAKGAAAQEVEDLAGRIMAVCREIDYDDLVGLGRPPMSVPSLGAGDGAAARGQPDGRGTVTAGVPGAGGVSAPFSESALALDAARVDRLVDEMSETRRAAVRGLLGRQVVAVDRGGEVTAEDRILGLLVCVPEALVEATLADALEPLPPESAGVDAEGNELLATDAERLASAADAVLAEARQGDPECTRTARLATVLALHGGWDGAAGEGGTGKLAAAHAPTGAPARLPDEVIERVRVVRSLLL